MKVKLLSRTTEMVDTLATAARCCYSKGDPTDFIGMKKSPEEYVEMLVDSGHFSAIEHVSFTFFISGISRACAQQLTRHRLMSFSMKSQRYVSEDSFDYVVPPSMEGKTVEFPDGRHQLASDYFSETMDILRDRYAVLQKALGGKKESSNEDARYVLPNACTTSLVVTMNLRNFLHFLEERLCSRSQWEIRELANMMLYVASNELPSVLLTAAGPKCKRLGHCPEHKSCGKVPAKG